MEKLRDLNQLAKDVVRNFNEKFEASDCMIPQAFKDNVKTLKSFSIVYNDYSVIIKGDGVRSKDSYVPNQSFYMASCFIEYSYELSRYKQKVLSLLSDVGVSTNELTAFFTHERDKGKEDIDKGEDKFSKILDRIGYSDSDRNYLIKFVTDYDWWSGSKTIDRSDFFNSPVLSIMGLSASSNAAMALIVDLLTQHPEYNDLLLNQIDNTKKLNMINTSLQQIFYGAPGTGKSNTIKRVVDDQHKTNFRVTFHPDSDYSTFVGCYKPTMKVNTISKNGVETKEEQIVYRFVPQAFSKAYTAAWNTEDDVYLIIEEINRGNCAQIFGDLFQLLDRKNGVSEYPVDADTDLADYIRKELKDSQRDFPKGVKEGNKLVLPSNLFIWATMNTSDQSLFPIDSAFKRRWDWKYMKIKDEHKDWKVDIDIKSKDTEGNETSKKLDWWTFVDKINKIIASMTSSADKQLGYFFCKATKKANDSDTEATIITKETFVSKVIFYLWNDVFRDYGFEDASLFRYKEVNSEAKKEEEKDLTFPDFYDDAGEHVNTERLTDFVEKLLNWQQTKEEQK